MSHPSFNSRTLILLAMAFSSIVVYSGCGVSSSRNEGLLAKYKSISDLVNDGTVGDILTFMFTIDPKMFAKQSIEQGYFELIAFRDYNSWDNGVWPGINHNKVDHYGLKVALLTFEDEYMDNGYFISQFRELFMAWGLSYNTAILLEINGIYAAD